MAIEVEKKFLIDGREAEVLSRVCELARRYIRDNLTGSVYQNGERKDLCLDEYSVEEVYEAEELMRDIWGH